jgi:hypothetical protein
MTWRGRLGDVGSLKHISPKVHRLNVVTWLTSVNRIGCLFRHVRLYNRTQEALLNVAVASAVASGAVGLVVSDFFEFTYWSV